MTFGTEIRNDLAVLVQVHVGRRGQRCLFAEVEESLAPIGQLNGHETTATEVAGRRVDHRQRISNRYRSIDSVAASLEHIDTHVGSQVLSRNDHAVFGSDRGL